MIKNEVRETYEAPERGKALRTFIYFISAILGLVFGILLYVWILLGAMHYTDVPKVQQGVTVAKSSAAQTTNVNGLFIDPNHPIKAVPKIDRAVTNILVFGVDERDSSGTGAGGPGRSDAMIVLSLDKRSNTIKLTSLMRDIEVDIEGREGEGDKLNSAYVHGGVGLLVNTVNQNFKLDIQDVMKFDFYSAADMIDALGGVKINITDDEVQYINQGALEQSANSNKAPQRIEQGGEQLLTGSQAVGWSRIRVIGDDYGRTSRQRTLMMSLMSQFAQQGVIAKTHSLVNAMPCVSTNISRTSLMFMGIMNVDCLGGMKEYRVPEDGMFSDSPSYNLILDWESQNAALHDFIYKQ